MGLPNIGPIELIIILAVLLLVVGPRRLPEMGQAVGKTIREFRKASTDITDAATVTPDAKSVSPAAAATVTAAASASPAPVPPPTAFPASAAVPEPASDPLTAARLPDAPPTDAPTAAAPLPSNDAAVSPGTDTTDDPSRQA
jgi:sec-independent protein translocase protein TatA